MASVRVYFYHNEIAYTYIFNIITLKIKERALFFFIVKEETFDPFEILDAEKLKRSAIDSWVKFVFFSHFVFILCILLYWESKKNLGLLPVFLSNETNRTNVTIPCPESLKFAKPSLVKQSQKKSYTCKRELNWKFGGLKIELHQ